MPKITCPSGITVDIKPRTFGSISGGAVGTFGQTGATGHHGPTGQPGPPGQPEPKELLYDICLRALNEYNHPNLLRYMLDHIDDFRQEVERKLLLES